MSRRAYLENKVKEFIEQNNLFEDVDHVIVAVSGGADSITTLRFMQKFKGLYGVTMSAIHVNHNIRGKASDMDQEFVEDYCNKNNIPLKTYQANKLLKVPENSSEEWARNVRYEFFELEASRLSYLGKTAIITAHNKTDQAETFIGNLVHGSGLNGLSGIPVKRDFKYRGKYKGKVIRPVLCLSRREIEELAMYYGLDFVVDETNHTDMYRRNRIRHHVLPALTYVDNTKEPEEYISDACDKIKEAYDFISEHCEKLHTEQYRIENDSISTTWLNSQHNVVKSYIIGKMLGEAKSKKLIEKVMAELNELKNTEINETAETQTSVVDVDKEHKIIITNENVYVREVGTAEVNPVRINSVPKEIKVNKYIKVRVEEVKDTQSLSNAQLKHITTVEKLSYKVLAGRDYGKNEFKPLGKKARKIKYWVKDTGIGVADRAAIPLIYDKDDNAIWMYGLGFTDEYAATIDDVKEGKRLVSVKGFYTGK